MTRGGEERGNDWKANAGLSSVLYFESWFLAFSLLFCAMRRKSWKERAHIRVNRKLTDSFCRLQIAI